MHAGNTALKNECRYLLRQPNEVLLEPEENPPRLEARAGGLHQEEALKQRVFIAYRQKKDPRDLLLLDPACGSGHFLLYAFDLLERIYEEAWHDPNSPKSERTGRALRDDFDSVEALKRAVPKAIIEYNLHGINPDTNPGTYHFKAGLCGGHGHDVHYVGTYDATPSRLAAGLLNLAAGARRLMRPGRTALGAPAHAAQRALRSLRSSP